MSLLSLFKTNQAILTLTLGLYSTHYMASHFCAKKKDSTSVPSLLVTIQL